MVRKPIAQFNSEIEHGEIFSWGKMTPPDFQNEFHEMVLQFITRKASDNVILNRVKPFLHKRVASVHCGGHFTAVIVVTALPTWQELKPLLVGWLKDSGCFFHHSKGLEIRLLQYIIELAWGCDLPSPLKI